MNSLRDWWAGLPTDRRDAIRAAGWIIAGFFLAPVVVRAGLWWYGLWLLP